MNITHSFATWLQTEGFGTLGTDIFIGAVPQDAPDVCFWVSSGGGGNQIKNKTGEKVKRYIVSVYYRSMDAEDVYNKLQLLEETINGECITLSSYDTIEGECTVFPTDQDIDSEERTKGMAQVTLTIYS